MVISGCEWQHDVIMFYRCIDTCCSYVLPCSLSPPHPLAQRSTMATPVRTDPLDATCHCRNRPASSGSVKSDSIGAEILSAHRTHAACCQLTAVSSMLMSGDVTVDRACPCI